MLTPFYYLLVAFFLIKIDTFTLYHKIFELKRWIKVILWIFWLICLLDKLGWGI